MPKYEFEVVAWRADNIVGPMKDRLNAAGDEGFSLVFGALNGGEFLLILQKPAEDQ